MGVIEGACFIHVEVVPINSYVAELHIFTVINGSYRNLALGDIVVIVDIVAKFADG